jgi:magnesium-transporting ATPase (P-type)
MREDPDLVKQKSKVVLENVDKLAESCVLGRNLFENMRKFLQYQMTVAVNLILYILISVVRHESAPIPASTILWINAVMDTIGAVIMCSGISETIGSIEDDSESNEEPG